MRRVHQHLAVALVPRSRPTATTAHSEHLRPADRTAHQHAYAVLPNLSDNGEKMLQLGEIAGHGSDDTAQEPFALNPCQAITSPPWTQTGSRRSNGKNRARPVKLRFRGP